MNEQIVNQVLRRVMAELGGPPVAGQPARPAGAPAASAPARVWLTAEALAARADGHSPVTLKMNEHLTPAARDYAAAAGIEVLRAAALPAAEPTAASPLKNPRRIQPAALTRTLGLVAARPDARAEAAIASAARGGVALEGFGDSSCWMANTRQMCAAINAGALAGGVVVARYAAAAVLLAAKIDGIRPVQGVSVAAVLATLRQYDANVLVIGHTQVSVYEMRSMIDRFAAGRRMGRDATPLLEVVNELEAKG